MMRRILTIAERLPIYVLAVAALVLILATANQNGTPAVAEHVTVTHIAKANS